MNENMPPLTTEAEQEYVAAKKTLITAVTVFGTFTWLAIAPALVILAWKAAL